MSKLHYRTVWISDTHLGLKEARSEFLLDFLKHTDCDTIYLVGDIIDLWKMRRGMYWPQINNEIVRNLMQKARNGTRVVYVPGNHDELFRDYVDMFFGGIEMTHEAEHVSADGKRYLVLHGDEFDCVVMNNKWLAYLGSEAYDFL
ncbi:MAG: UDP-2,3-diacylglucosamine diphosphatase, partial [Gammaproteobacteria bacterium]